MIYLDNSATSYPKPRCVIDSVYNSMTRFGANSGRGSYKMALDTTEQIYNCRKKVAGFFKTSKIENVIFTHNCTMALNMAIKGVAEKGCHFIISDLEHNAVLRPLHKLKEKGYCDYSIACVENDVYSTLKNFENCINENTTAIICTGASNVFGITLPYSLLATLAHRYGLLFILDASQIAGNISVNMTESKIDILCCSGHKGLLGPSGTGVLIINDDITLNTIFEGGTGSSSANYNQPSEYPDRMESGTPNISGIIGLSNAIDFINQKGIKHIYSHEIELLKYLQWNMGQLDNVVLYTNFFDINQRLSPIMSFNIKNMHSEDVAAKLSENEIAVRAGLHCAPLAHQKFETLDTGTVRISPSFFNKKSDIDFLINSVKKIAK